MATVQWYIARTKEKVGPFSPIQLKQLVELGVLESGDLVLAAGASKWVEASTIPGLFSDSDQKKYWLKHEGRTRGPFVLEQLRAGLATREWTLEAQVWSDEEGEVKPLSQLSEMREFVPMRVTGSQAQLLTGSLEIEEATLHIAGKHGDETAALISMFLDLKRAHADNPRFVEQLNDAIEELKNRRNP